jgi:hypothetical protein
LLQSVEMSVPAGKRSLDCVVCSRVESGQVQSLAFFRVNWFRLESIWLLATRSQLLVGLSWGSLKEAEYINKE